MSFLHHSQFRLHRTQKLACRNRAGVLSALRLQSRSIYEASVKESTIGEETRDADVDRVLTPSTAYAAGSARTE